MDDSETQNYIRIQLRKAGQSNRRIRFNVFRWGLQFDGAIVSHKGNPVLVWNFLGKSGHRSDKKHKAELVKRGIKEFEIPLLNQWKMKLAVIELVDYVQYRRSRGKSLKVYQNVEIMRAR